jgi:hypothetical protein
MSGAQNGLPDVAGTPSKGAQPGQPTRMSTRAKTPRALFVAEDATTANKRAGFTYASAVGKQHKAGPAEGPEHKANMGAPEWPAHMLAHMLELEKTPANERQDQTVPDRHARTPQQRTDSNARVTEIPGIDNRPDMNPLKLKGGELLEELDRFEEVWTGGGDSLSCWALASKDQINLMTHHIYGWYSVDVMRESVARKILQGDAQEMSERLQGLWWDLETNPVLRHEFLEQRKVRAEHEFSAQRKVRATLAVPDPGQV